MHLAVGSDAGGTLSLVYHTKNCYGYRKIDEDCLSGIVEAKPHVENQYYFALESRML